MPTDRVAEVQLATQGSHLLAVSPRPVSDDIQSHPHPSRAQRRDGTEEGGEALLRGDSVEEDQSENVDIPALGRSRARPLGKAGRDDRDLERVVELAKDRRLAIACGDDRRGLMELPS